MTEQAEKLDEIEQLSLLIDELNKGRNPHCDDVDTAELLLIADILRKEGGVIQPPQHILDQTVDRALTGIAAGHTNTKRIWWYSSTLSTAAAVLLIIGFNLLPSWQQLPAMIQPPTIQLEPAAPSTQTAPPQISPPQQIIQHESATSSESSSNYIEPRTADPIQPTAVSTPSAIQPTAPTVLKEKAITTPPTKSKVDMPVSPVKIAEETGPKGYAKSLNLLDEPLAAPSKSAAKELEPLVLPGKSPDQVVFDKEQGLLRQVFFQGTPQELTIIQRKKRAETRSKQEKTSPPPADIAADSQKDSLHTVQLTIDGQEVTLEGRQSPQELRKLAKTLAPNPNP